MIPQEPELTPAPTALLRSTVAFGIALAVASVFDALLVILKETSPGTMALMKRATGHHWATHSLLSLMLFFALGAILPRLRGGRGFALDGKSLLKLMSAAVIVSVGGILGFYIIGD